MEDINGINTIIEDDKLSIGRLVLETNATKNEPSLDESNGKKKRSKLRQGQSKLRKEKLKP